MGVAAQQQDSIPEKWTLQQCIAYAIDHSISVKTTEFTRETSALTYQQSKIERFPNLSANASQGLTNGTSIDPITSDFVSQTIHSTSLSLSASVTLYNGNKITNQIRQNRLSLEQNSLYVQEAKNSIVLSIIEVYLRVQYYLEGVRIADNQVVNIQKQLEQTEARYKAGSASPKDVADIKSQFAQYTYESVTARNSYEQQVLTLKQLLELPTEVTFEPVDMTDELQDPVVIPGVVQVYAEALERMPEIRAAQLQSEIKAYDLKIAKSGYLPSLSLSGSISSGYTNTQGLNFSDQLRGNLNQRLMLNLSVPIFSRYKNKMGVEQAKISILNADLSLESAKKELYKKIESAWQNAVAASSEMEAARASMEAAESAYELARQQFDRGALDPVSLYQSQTTYTNAKQSFLQAKYMELLYARLLRFYQENEIKW